MIKKQRGTKLSTQVIALMLICMMASNWAISVRTNQDHAANLRIAESAFNFGKEAFDGIAAIYEVGKELSEVSDAM